MARLLDALREAGAREQAAALASRGRRPRPPQPPSRHAMRGRGGNDAGVKAIFSAPEAASTSARNGHGRRNREMT